MTKPSTAWKERIADDEAQRFERWGEEFAAMQRAKSRKQGNGRALHRKQLLGLPATLRVLDSLPLHARQGLFARPGRHDALIRLSNGGADRVSDRRPDVRGFGLKVLGVRGPAALGGEAASQDFALINHPAFSFPRPEPFVELVMAASRGPASLLRHLVASHGVVGALRQLKRLKSTFGKPFTGFATETFWSAAPIACGPYAARVRLVPVDAGAADPPAPAWADGLRARLAGGRPLRWALQLQFYVDEARTPIEDASVDWPESLAPYVTVAELEVAASALAAADDTDFQRRIEDDAFDPWRALEAHRPLGAVMRARKAVYFVSQQQRAQAAAPGS